MNKSEKARMAGKMAEMREAKLWKEFKESWNAIDKVYVTLKEFKNLAMGSLNKSDRQECIRALLMEDQKIFYDNFVFIVTGKGNKPLNYISFTDISHASAIVTSYDGEGNLFWRFSITENQNYRDVIIHPDDSNPFGSIIVKDLIKSHPNKSTKKLSKKIDQLQVSEIKTIMDFVFNSIHSVLNRVEYKEKGSALKKSKGRTKQMLVNRDKRTGVSVSLTKLRTIIYENQQEDEKGSSHSFVRHAKNWTVRGHWRTYKKSGKKVWVKAHVKGNISKDVKGKSYQL